MKKRILSTVLAIAVFFSMMFSISSFANQSVSVYVDNELIQFDVAPRIVNGRTMVPMRAIFEKLGAEVTWDDTTQTAHACNYGTWKGVSVTIGESYMLDIQKNIIGLDVPAFVENGRTLIPLRAVSEAFGCEVIWDESTFTVTIFSEDFIDYSVVTDDQTTVEVATAQELLNSIGNNTKIVLTSDYYNLSDVAEVNNSFVEKQFYYDNGNSGIYSIKNVVNLTIEGNAQIVIDNINADVLNFNKCGLITLSGLTIGHTESLDNYQCEGAVISLTSCDDVYITNCNLFGCGAFGICADRVTSLSVANSKIYDCTYTGIWLSGGSEASVYQTEFFDSVHESGFLRIDNSFINCTECNVHDITCNDSVFIDTFDFGGEPSVITLTNCRFENNKFNSVTGDGNQKVIFNNCSFENNTGNMEHPSVTYTQ